MSSPFWAGTLCLNLVMFDVSGYDYGRGLGRSRETCLTNCGVSRVSLRTAGVRIITDCEFGVVMIITSSSLCPFGFDHCTRNFHGPWKPFHLSFWTYRNPSCLHLGELHLDSITLFGERAHITLSLPYLQVRVCDWDLVLLTTMGRVCVDAWVREMGELVRTPDILEEFVQGWWRSGSGLSAVWEWEDGVLA